MALAPLQRKQIMISVDAGVYDRLEARARVMNYSASRYAQLLFDAAYHARAVRERGQVNDDAELDRQVVTVFALASADSDAISKATDIPIEIVRKVLSGWKLFGSVTPPGAVADKPGAVPPPAASGHPRPEKRKSSARNAYSAEVVKTIIGMYRDGALVKDIAAAIGRPKGSVEMWISNHRESCPRRR